LGLRVRVSAAHRWGHLSSRRGGSAHTTP
jgi:hypothetical protein